MTDTEIRIAIAEWSGWKLHRQYDGHPYGCGVWLAPNGQMVNYDVIPDYPNDLNAIHEAEKGLDGEKDDEHSQKQAYYENLIFVVGGQQDPPDCYEWDLFTATACQRCEALLRTLGLWKG